jgi:hypothetical protein
VTARVAALLFLGFVVTACASVDNKDYWWKPGMTKDEFAHDDAQCRQMSAVPSSRTTGVGGTRIRTPSAEVDENAYSVCLEAYGYEKVPKDFVPTK